MRGARNKSVIRLATVLTGLRDGGERESDRGLHRSWRNGAARLRNGLARRFDTHKLAKTTETEARIAATAAA